MKTEVEINAKMELYLEARHERSEEEQERWKEKHDFEMSEINDEIETLQKSFEDCNQKIKDLTPEVTKGISKYQIVVR